MRRRDSRDSTRQNKVHRGQLSIITPLVFFIGAFQSLAARAQRDPSGSESLADQIEIQSDSPCLQAPALAAKIWELRPQRWPEDLRIRLFEATPQAQLRVEFHTGSKRLGIRTFFELPQNCKQQRSLIATVIAVTLDDPQLGLGPTSSTSTQTTTESNDTKATSVNDADSRTTSSAAQRDFAAAKQNTSSPDPSTAREDVIQDVDEPDKQNQDSTSNPTSRIPQRKARRSRPPIRLQDQRFAAAIGASWGRATSVGPQVDIGYGWSWRRMSLRSALSLNYGPPIRLGDARVHSAVASLDLRVCARSADIPAVRERAELCMGMLPGLFAAAGQGFDEDRRGAQPWAASDMSLEVPLYRGSRSAIFLRVAVGINWLRPRLYVARQDVEEAMADSAHNFTLPLINTGANLWIRW